MSNLKSVLITGSNRGLGLEFVRQLVSQENGPKHIFACCRDPAKAIELKKIADNPANAGRVHPIELDVVNDTQIDQGVKYVESIVGNEGLNLLINNAGVLEREQSILPNVDRANLVRHFDINAAAPVMIAQAFLPLLRKAAEVHGGEKLSIFRSAVINVSSGIGSISQNTSGSGMTGYGYRLSKAALNMATKCMAIDLKQDNILFVSVCPGWVQTDMGGQRAMLTPEQSVSALLKTFAQFSDEHNGGFYQREGNPLGF